MIEGLFFAEGVTLMEETAFIRLKNELMGSINAGSFKKAILSKPTDKGLIKTVITAFLKNGEIFLKLEAFKKDGKAIQTVLPYEDGVTLICEKTGNEFMQADLIAEGKTAVIMVSSKGKVHFSGTLAGATASKFLPATQDKVKNYILTPENDGGFLEKLGICTKNGAIHDKKQAKYRQINKFLEQIESIVPNLPKSGTLTVCDLCCGKSYLTFAAYWYFTTVLKRETAMYGIDLKPDVIEYCSALAKSLGWEGMHFECGDVSRFVPPARPDLVLSLHACDVATDYVLAGAIRQNARVILSTPCCQHEINRKMNAPALGFMTEHSMIKQKLAAAATDALRAKMLEIHGYKVTVCELIDPEETPKNLLIRAVKRTRVGAKTSESLAKEYDEACALLGVQPTLKKLVGFPNIPKSVTFTEKESEK